MAAFTLLLVGLLGCNHSGTTIQRKSLPAEVTMSLDALMDKIKGGWAGKTIACTYAGPTEFKFNGTMIQDYTPISWPDGIVKQWYTNSSGLYDDIYMNLTFVNVFDRLGLDLR
jgi:hypothetical protein